MSKGLIPILQKKETEIEFPSNFFLFFFHLQIRLGGMKVFHQEERNSRNSEIIFYLLLSRIKIRAASSLFLSMCGRKIPQKLRYGLCLCLPYLPFFQKQAHVQPQIFAAQPLLRNVLGQTANQRYYPRPVYPCTRFLCFQFGRSDRILFP